MTTPNDRAVLPFAFKPLAIFFFNLRRYLPRKVTKWLLTNESSSKQWQQKKKKIKNVWTFAHKLPAINLSPDQNRRRTPRRRQFQKFSSARKTMHATTEMWTYLSTRRGERPPKIEKSKFYFLNLRRSRSWRALTMGAGREVPVQRGKSVSSQSK